MSDDWNELQDVFHAMDVAWNRLSGGAKSPKPVQAGKDSAPLALAFPSIAEQQAYWRAKEKEQDDLAADARMARLSERDYGPED